MKFLILTLLFSPWAFSVTDNYFKNDGSVPESLSSKTNRANFQTRVFEEEEDVPATSSDSGVRLGTGLSTKDVNTSSTPAPLSDQEVIDNSVLRNGPKHLTAPMEEADKEAQEEDALDYSTTPQKRQ